MSITGFEVYRCLLCSNWRQTNDKRIFEAHVFGHQTEALRILGMWQAEFEFWNHWWIRWLPGAKTERDLARLGIERWSSRERLIYEEVTKYQK